MVRLSRRPLRARLASPIVASLLLIGVGACGGATPRPTSASLRVHAEPETASVYVDGRFFSSARALAKHPKPLSPGLHLVTVEAPDHFPHDFEVKLAAGTTTVRVKLRPVPP